MLENTINIPVYGQNGRWAVSGDRLPLGYRGEADVQRIVFQFDIDLPEAAYRIEIRNETQNDWYRITKEGNNLIFLVPPAITQFNGRVMLQIVAVSGGEDVKKSNPFTGIVFPSLMVGEEIEHGEISEFEKALADYADKMAEAKGYSESAQASADNAQTSAEDARLSAQLADTYKTLADTSSVKSAESASNAEDAAESAERSAELARSAMTIAQTSAEDALSARDGAVQAKNDTVGYAQQAAEARDEAKLYEKTAEGIRDETTLFYENTVKFASEAQQSAESASQSASSASNSAESASRSEYMAGQYSTNASQSADLARQSVDASAGNALDAMGYATEAAASAALAESAAEGIVVDYDRVETARIGAEVARDASEFAKLSAQQSSLSASQSAQQATVSAASAASSASNATNSAINAENAKGEVLQAMSDLDQKAEDFAQIPKAGDVMVVASVNPDGSLVLKKAESVTLKDVVANGESVVSDGVADVSPANIGAATAEGVQTGLNAKVGYSEVVNGQLLMYTNSTKSILLAALDLPAAPVQDVQIGGNSVVDDSGIGKIPLASNTTFGTVKAIDSFGIYAGNGILCIEKATNANIVDRHNYKPIVPGNLPFAVKSAMTSTTDPEWSDAEKEASKARMGVNDIFWCTYGVTTYAEITQALSDGKYPVCIFDGKYYPYITKDGSGRYAFAEIYSNIQWQVRCKTDNTWNYESTGLLINSLDVKQEAVKQALTSGGEWTSEQQLAARQLIGVEKEWTLVESFNCDGEDRGNVDTRAGVDLTGYTELLVKTKITATGTVSLENPAFIMASGIGFNGSRMCELHFMDGFDGYRAVSARSINSLTGLYYNTSVQTYEPNNNLFVKNIRTLWLGGSANISFCDVKIYAR